MMRPVPSMINPFHPGGSVPTRSWASWLGLITAVNT
jgi:hypothetical protein